MILTSSIALVGCGAIAEDFYIPALRKAADYQNCLWLVDPAIARTSRLASKYGMRATHVVSSIKELPDDVKGAINATPSHLHAQTSIELIERKLPVFIEKPMAESVREANEILKAAGQLPLSSNQYRRRYPASLAIRDHIKTGKLGRLRRLVWHEGGKFDWPTLSGFYFRRPWSDGRPRGALLDTGAHILDLICWWLGERPTVIQAWMDSFGGPEAFVTLGAAAGDMEIEVKISFISRLQNEVIIEGDKGIIRHRPYEPRRFYFQPLGQQERTVNLPGPENRAAVAHELMSNFLDVIEGRSKSLLIDAASVVPSLEMIDRAYSIASTKMPSYYRAWVARS
jgi:predicted dehydrogenase